MQYRGLQVISKKMLLWRLEAGPALPPPAAPHALTLKEEGKKNNHSMIWDRHTKREALAAAQRSQQQQARQGQSVLGKATIREATSLSVHIHLKREGGGEAQQGTRWWPVTEGGREKERAPQRAHKTRGIIRIARAVPAAGDSALLPPRSQPGLP
ncbi:UNVERIFIED_CONTAM: hypothetical protein K2H54_054859 [Gekko kuhli]